MAKDPLGDESSPRYRSASRSSLLNGTKSVVPLA